MHISNVSGHHSASLAIENAIKIKQPETEILSLNIFNYVHPLGEKIINFLYMLTIKRLPFIWHHLYDNTKWFKRTRKLKNMIHDLNLPKLEILLNSFKPDVVISTQAFPCGLIADYKRIKGINVPLIAVLTDFAPHSYWIYDTVDYYIVPSEEIKQRLIQKGVAPERIKDLGIPFSLKFSQNLNKSEARKRLNLNEELFTILVMGGGQGLGPIKKVIKVLNSLNVKFQQIVVCGTNKDIYQSLKKKVIKYKNETLLFHYAKNINELMSAADLIITKPGGITCAEALSKGLPMIIISPIPGQEANNTNYLTNKGAAIKADRPDDLKNLIQELYQDRHKLENLSKACLQISKPNTAENIAELVLNL